MDPTFFLYDPLVYAAFEENIKLIHWGQFCMLGDIWHYLNTFLVIRTGVGGGGAPVL